MSPAFRMLKQFDQAPGAKLLERGIRVRRKHASHFPGDNLVGSFGRALCEEEATSIKEITEAFEFFQAVRKYVVAPRMADICSGHGLVGVLFALFERKVEQVTLIDRAQPESFERIMAAADRIGPWTREKVTFELASLKSAADAGVEGLLTPGTGLVGVHACGGLTDEIIELGMRLRSPLALLPCCHQHRVHPAPEVLKRVLGGDRAIDVDRTYVLDRAGYQVRWKEIPEAITPKNRVLIGVPREG